MLAKILGQYGAELKTIAVDANGVMKANLSAQDLDFLRVRPVYGSAKRAYSSINCLTGQETSLISITGRGATIGGFGTFNPDSYGIYYQLKLYVDGTLIQDLTVDELQSYNIQDYDRMPIYILRYLMGASNPFEVEFGISPRITFESSIELKFYNGGPTARYVSTYFYYALVPS
jgi:hypothetical protein